MVGVIVWKGLLFLSSMLHRFPNCGIQSLHLIVCLSFVPPHPPFSKLLVLIRLWSSKFTPHLLNRLKILRMCLVREQKLGVKFHGWPLYVKLYMELIHDIFNFTPIFSLIPNGMEVKIGDKISWIGFICKITHKFYLWKFTHIFTPVPKCL